jgi:acetyl esterase/lipase
MYRFLLIAILIVAGLSASAQTTCSSSQRYKKQVFSRVNVTRDIVYEKADKYDPLNINFPEDIKLDFYEPANDGLTKRPLFIFFFGGAFEIGDKGDADVKAWCDSLARHGYATAAVNYRLGFNIASTASAIRAVYRAVQDSRAAIRFFK